MVCSLFIASVPGLEDVVAQELVSLGAPPGKVVPGGVAVEADPSWVGVINRWSACATRVLLRVGAFRARHLSELHKKAGALDWLGLIDRRPLRVRVTSHASRLYHTGAVAERIHSVLSDRAGRELSIVRGDALPEDLSELQTVFVRIEKDEVTISLDSSGDHLHRRGYRKRTAKAPLRENLAAAFLRLTGWPEPGVLLDPLCGSGTIPIEAALLASGSAPGAGRRFAFEHWGEGWDHEMAPPAPRPDIRVFARDRDRGAIEATLANAEQAGVAAMIEAEVGSISGATRVSEQGLLLTNPPYGRRIGKKDPLRDLYASLGRIVRERFGGWRACVVCGRPELMRACGMPFEARTGPLDHGGLSIRLYEPSLRS
ncbi:MAG: class I SAM-dependent RNA methyltransferase [Planctomycetota bacterium]